MLVLLRKAGESIVVANEVVVRVIRVSPTRAFLAIEAPPNIRVDRKEVRLAKNQELGKTNWCETGETRAAPGDEAA